jgi:hypothetical protein
MPQHPNGNGSSAVLGKCLVCAVLVALACNSAMSEALGPRSWPILSIAAWNMFVTLQGWQNLGRAMMMQVCRVLCAGIVRKVPAVQ